MTLCPCMVTMKNTHGVQTFLINLAERDKGTSVHEVPTFGHILT